MFPKKQKPLIVIASLVLVFSFFSFVYALETDLPEMGGVKPDATTKLPDYIKYLFNFSIAMAGIVAFGVIVWAGIKILTSPDQPETIKDARTKMVGALLGIVILLSSYLILTTINPQLAFIGLDKDLKPVSGIYLIKGEEKEYIAMDTPKVTLDGATLLEFLSTKDELISVFAYSGENYTGTETEIQNPKSNQETVAQSSVPSPKSIALVWHNPGVYLYPETNFRGRPRFFNTSVSSLSNYDFDKKTKSIKFINTTSTVYGAIFFTQSDSRGQCGFVSIDDTIPNLSAGSENYRNPIGSIDGGLSSFRIFNYHLATPGNVVFYDAPNCTGHSSKEAVPAAQLYYNPSLSKQFFPDAPSISLQDHIISFQINGNFGVLLATKEDFKGRCQFFTKPSADNCYPSIESTYLWENTEWEYGPKVGTWVIVPLSE